MAFRSSKPKPKEGAGANGCTPIGEVVARRRVTVTGAVSQVRARPRDGVPSLLVTIADGSGSINVHWMGRRSLGGVTLGRRLRVEGVPCLHRGRLEFTNPAYELLP